MSTSEQNKLLRLASSYLDDAKKAAQGFWQMAADNAYVAEPVLEREIIPILQNANLVVDEMLTMGSEDNDFAEIDSLLSSLAFTRARLYDALVSGWSRFPDTKKEITRSRRSSQQADLESLLMSRDPASLYNTAIGEAGAGRVPVALKLLQEAEEHYGDDDVGIMATKARRQYQADHPGIQPAPLGMPGDGKLFKDLCVRYPAYGRSSGVAMRQLHRALNASDSAYVVALLIHYESTRAPSRLLADLLANGFRPLRDLLGTQTVTDWGLRWSKELSPQDRQRVADVMRDDLFARLTAAPPPARRPFLEDVLGLFSEGGGKELTAWFQTQVEAGPNPGLIELGEHIAARLAEPDASQVRATTGNLIRTLMRRAAAGEWPRLMTSLSLCAEMLDDDVDMFTQIARDVDWVPVGVAIVKMVRGAARERARVHTVNLALHALGQSDAASWPPLLDHLFAVDPGGATSGAALVAAYATQTTRPTPDVAALGVRIATSLGENEAATATPLALGVLLALLNEKPSGEASMTELAIIDDILRLDSGDATCARLITWFETRLHDDGFDVPSIGRRLAKLPQPHGQRSIDLSREEIVARLERTPPWVWSHWLKALRSFAPGYAGLESTLTSAFQRLAERAEHDDPLVAGDELAAALPRVEAQVVRDLVRTRLERLITSEKRRHVRAALARRVVDLFPENETAKKLLHRAKDRRRVRLIIGSAVVLCVLVLLVVAIPLLLSHSR